MIEHLFNSKKFLAVSSLFLCIYCAGTYHFLGPEPVMVVASAIILSFLQGYIFATLSQINKFTKTMTSQIESGVLLNEFNNDEVDRYMKEIDAERRNNE